MINSNEHSVQYNGNQYLSDRLSHIWYSMDCYYPSDTQLNIPNGLIDAVHDISYDFNAYHVKNYGGHFYNSFTSLLNELNEMDLEYDQPPQTIRNKVLTIEQGLQKQIIELKDLKNSIAEIRDAFTTCDENFCLFDENSPETPDQLTWHFNEAIRVINDDDLQYMIDSYQIAQTDSIA